jgi:hypothetical protein
MVPGSEFASSDARLDERVVGDSDLSRRPRSPSWLDLVSQLLRPTGARGRPAARSGCAAHRIAAR